MAIAFLRARCHYPACRYKLQKKHQRREKLIIIRYSGHRSVNNLFPRFHLPGRCLRQMVNIMSSWSNSVGETGDGCACSKAPPISAWAVISFHDLIIYRWAEDSSGVYLSDYIPGKGALFIIEPSRPAYVSLVKKVLVPCRGSLAGVALLPRLYWEMRCAFPEPYSFVAVWLPLVVMPSSR